MWKPAIWFIKLANSCFIHILISFIYFATENLTQTEKEEDEYPRWASVSPDGKIGVFSKNNNLFWMDAENMKKAAKDEKDSTIVEHRLTSDGIIDYGYGYGNYTGNTDRDTTKRRAASMLVWSPDSKHFATYKYDMRELKELWVINSLSNPRPTLETFKYQMPGNHPRRKSSCSSISQTGATRS